MCVHVCARVCVNVCLEWFLEACIFKQMPFRVLWAHSRWETATEGLFCHSALCNHTVKGPGVSYQTDVMATLFAGVTGLSKLPF